VRAGLTIGGIEVEVRVPSGDLEDVVADRFGPFLGAVVAPVCRLQMAATGATRVEQSSPVAEVQGAGTDRVKLVHRDFEAKVDLSGTGSLVTAANPFAVDHAFRVLFALLAPRHDALILHSCGVITHGRAHVFAGKSGAGKSTLASLAGHRPLLSDEHVVVRRRPGGWVAASTPFSGSHPRSGPARQAPLARLWSLQHARTHALVGRAPEHGLRTAYDNALLPCGDHAIKTAVYAVAGRLAADVPAGELRFALDEGVWEEIEHGAAVV